MGGEIGGKEVSRRVLYRLLGKRDGKNSRSNRFHQGRQRDGTLVTLHPASDEDLIVIIVRLIGFFYMYTINRRRKRLY